MINYSKLKVHLPAFSGVFQRISEPSSATGAGSGVFGHVISSGCVLEGIVAAYGLCVVSFGI